MSHKPIDLEWGWVRIQYGPDNSVEKDLPLKEKDNLKNRKVGELVEEIFSNAKFASSIGLASESDPLQWTIHEVKQKDRRAPEELRELGWGEKVKNILKRWEEEPYAIYGLRLDARTLPLPANPLLKGAATTLLHKVKKSGKGQEAVSKKVVDEKAGRVKKRLSVQIEGFGEPDFNANNCVTSMFKERGTEGIETEVLPTLRQVAQEARETLLDKVYEHYGEFIGASQEIGELQKDMLELNEHLNTANLLLRSLNQLSFGHRNAPNKTNVQTTRKQTELLSYIHSLLELPDELDILTSERLFDQAVKKIKDARNKVKQKPELAIAESYIKPELNRRIKNLSEVLISDLSDTALKKSEANLIIEYLQELGFDTKAREVFLEVKKKQIEMSAQELRKMPFGAEGDNIIFYVTQLCGVFFGQIGNAWDEFRLTFPLEVGGNNTHIVSGFVVWSISLCKLFLEEFSHHVFGISTDFDRVEACFTCMMSHVQVLENKGISLKFYLRQEFQNFLNNAIEEFRKHLDAGINGQFHDEKWQVKPFTIDENRTLMMTESGCYIYSALTKLARVIPFISPSRLYPVVKTLCLLDKYFFELSTNAEKCSINASNLKEYLGMIANAKNLSENLLLGILNVEIECISFRQQVMALQNRINVLYEDIKSVYCKRSAKDIVDAKLHWHKVTYVVLAPNNIDSSGISTKFLRLFSHLASVCFEISEALGKDSENGLILDMLEQIILGMTTGLFWENEKSKTQSMFSPEGLQQFLLDFKFSEEASGHFLTTKAKEAIKEIRERALVHFCGVHKISDISKVPVDVREQNKIVSAALEKHRTLLN